MGYNPFRKRVSRGTDVVVVAAALVVIVGLLVWALFPPLMGPFRSSWDPDEVEVRHVQPYQAVKTYRCPGCDHEIRPGTGHEVVVPLDAPDLRRHWHTPCWARVTRAAGRVR